MMNAKEDLRRRFLLLRDSLDKRERSRLSEMIQESVISLDEFRSCESIGNYSAIGSEVDTSMIARYSLIQGKSLAYPRIIDSNTMEFRLVRDASLDLVVGRYSILEPLDSCEYVEPELLIVPAIVWDEEGYRIGYGKGYYDRYLAKHDALCIGLAYDFQVLSSIPHTSNDAKVDIIITERRILYTD
jgi:5-formyltetrahydrofolate cyclo-ligase